MFFTIKNFNTLARVPDQFLKTNAYLSALFIIENYPIRASERALDLFLKQQYKIGLKDLSKQLISKLTINKNKSGDFILLFNDPEDDRMARLITYGNGIVPGCKILLLSLNQNRED